MQRFVEHTHFLQGMGTTMFYRIKTKGFSYIFLRKICLVVLMEGDVVDCVIVYNHC